MSIPTRLGAVLLAATEILPAEWRDLSDALATAGDPEILLSEAPIEGSREVELLAFLRSELDHDRVGRWHKRLDTLMARHPRVSLMAVTDGDYPARLAACYDRPPFVFVDGELDAADRAALAIVGSRHASEQALSVARQVAEAAAEAGITVVSGLARGVDAAAHRGALRAGGRTLAVIAGGIDRTIYPAEHAGLAEEIRLDGAVISQFRPGSPPTTSSFPLRNAVISGLSACSFLVEAGERSGTRTEADHSLRQGRPVLMWAPLMERQPWAVEFARNGLVHLVSTIDDLLTTAGQLAHESPTSA